MKINKNNIEKYAALSLCGFAMAASMVSFKCEKTMHSKEECPITRIELGLGFEKSAIKHQLVRAMTESKSSSAQYGNLEKKYFRYDVLEDAKNGEKFDESILKKDYDSCIIRDENDNWKMEDITFACKNVGTGIMSKNNFLLLKKAKKNNDVIDNEDSSNFAREYVEKIKYIGPAGKNVENAVVLEDRDGVKKEVIADNLKENDLKDLFKTFYYDAEDGLYKIDESLFVEFIRSRVVESRSYTSLIAKFDQKTNTHTVTVPDGCFLAPNGLACKIILTVPYQNFSMYNFKALDLENNLDQSDNITRKLSR